MSVRLTGIWYVGKSQNLRVRLLQWINADRLSGWDKVVWTEIDSSSDKAFRIAESIRLEQLKRFGVRVKNVDGNVSPPNKVIEWFEKGYYHDPRIVSNWPDWLINPWP
jgi:hypothetical protein